MPIIRPRRAPSTWKGAPSAAFRVPGLLRDGLERCDLEDLDGAALDVGPLVEGPDGLDLRAVELLRPGEDSRKIGLEVRPVLAVTQKHPARVLPADTHEAALDLAYIDLGAGLVAALAPVATPCPTARNRREKRQDRYHRQEPSRELRPHAFTSSGTRLRL